MDVPTKRVQLSDSEITATRAGWLGVLSRARSAEVEALAGRELAEIAFEWVRPPHAGLVMVRGRAGGTGAVFNLGEMTVTRCSIRLADGSVGYGYAQGRSHRQAQLAALVDALLQNDEWRPRLMISVIEPLRASEAERRLLRNRKAASTKVEFFTMVRGEDPA